MEELLRPVQVDPHPPAVPQRDPNHNGLGEGLPQATQAVAVLVPLVLLALAAVVILVLPEGPHQPSSGRTSSSLPTLSSSTTDALSLTSPDDDTDIVS